MASSSSTSLSSESESRGGMANGMIYSVVTSLVPMFLVVGIGIIAAKRKLLDTQHEQGLNRFIVWVATPAVFFRLLARSEFMEIPWAVAGLVALHRIFS
jgi:predicted permease